MRLRLSRRDRRTADEIAAWTAYITPKPVAVADPVSTRYPRPLSPRVHEVAALPESEQPGPPYEGRHRAGFAAGTAAQRHEVEARRQRSVHSAWMAAPALRPAWDCSTGALFTAVYGAVTTGELARVLDRELVAA